MPANSPSKRYYALDLLRGLFIVIIIVDHLSRWPNAFELLSGKAILWVTAAEGFVIISGLLVGYIRGYKAINENLRSVSRKLWSRALTLYAWAVIGSILYTMTIWYLPLAGGAPGLPMDKGDWQALVFESIRLEYTFLWVYFLKLYAIFLAAAPLAIWLLRTGKAWLAGLLSLTLLGIGLYINDETLQWQFVFFIPVIAGYYMPQIQNWWHALSTPNRHTLAISTVSLTAITILVSVVSIHSPETSLVLDRSNITSSAEDTVSLLRALMAFLWFTGYLFVFIYLQKYILRWLGWLLMPIGTRSLTAYIIHGVALLIISSFTISSENSVLNTLLSAIAIVLVWAGLKIPGINRIIPR